MKKNTDKFFIILYFLSIVPTIAFNQQLLLDPSTISFPQAGAPNILDANEPANIKIIAETDWEITCQAEPLVHSNGMATIPIERIFIQHHLSGGAFVPINSSFVLGSGEPTNGTELLFNTLFFRVETVAADPTGNYLGVVRFFDRNLPLTELTLQLAIDPTLDFHLSSRLVQFKLNGAPGIYVGEPPVELTVEGNTADWQIEARVSSGNEFSGSNIFVESSLLNYPGNDGAGTGFKVLGRTPIILNGSEVGTSGTTLLTFKAKSDWEIEPGNYHSVIELKVPQSGASQYIDVNMVVSEYVNLELSRSAVQFSTFDGEGIFDGDAELDLTIASNTGDWEVNVEAEALSTKGSHLPTDRLFLASSALGTIGDEGAGEGYMCLNRKRMLFSGKTTAASHVSSLAFRIKTLWGDKHGQYSGKIYFTIVAVP